ncbi:MAG: hypothetical protein IPJ65_04045 [Archangiaceae bacterium]|nr:hypothetical protein [Archangiaceae bacterium]
MRTLLLMVTVTFFGCGGTTPSATCSSISCTSGQICAILNSGPQCFTACSPGTGTCSNGSTCTCGSTCAGCDNCVKVCP